MPPDIHSSALIHSVTTALPMWHIHKWFILIDEYLLEIKMSREFVFLLINVPKSTRNFADILYTNFTNFGGGVVTSNNEEKVNIHVRVR